MPACTIAKSLITKPRPALVMDGDLRSTFMAGTQEVVVYFSRTEGNFHEATQVANKFNRDPRRSPVPILTEMRRSGRWYLVGQGSDCPSF